MPEKQEEENENNGGDENEQIKSGLEDDVELKEHDNSSLKGIGLYENCLLTIWLIHFKWVRLIKEHNPATKSMTRSELILRMIGSCILLVSIFTCIIYHFIRRVPHKATLPTVELTASAPPAYNTL